MQTATDPNAHDRPEILAYLTTESFRIWQKPQTGYASQTIPLEAITLNASGTRQWNSQWLNESESRGEYIKVDHGGTPPTAGPIDSETWIYSYDANGNVDTIDSSIGATVYGYDALDRIINDDKPGQPLRGLDYDRNGNRTSLSEDSVITTYTYQANSNQLDTLNGNSIQHDPAGNRSSDQNGNRTFEYNNAGRLFKARTKGDGGIKY